MLDSLEECPLLERVSFCCRSMAWNMPEYKISARFSRFCHKLKHLVALFGVVKIPIDVCEKVNTNLRNTFQVERPPFVVDLQSTNWRNNSSSSVFDSQILPLMHSEVLTRIHSQVAILPFGTPV